MVTVRVSGYHEICPVCGRQDDGGDHRGPDRYIGGPHRVTLREARQNYAESRASELRWIDRVRDPSDNRHPAEPDQRSANRNSSSRRADRQQVDGPDLSTFCSPCARRSSSR
ncbi:CPCC family cysteine-rich protein [Streptomyces vinaceus]|uniref:CPCC family cysteine-rich protein n=1 Tax=Streptomyces vinaceus TaxID=1960 RepID=UPI0038143E5A